MIRALFTLAVLIGLAVATAQAQNCTQRPDGFGGSRTYCDDGTTATTRPDGFGGSRTFIQPPPSNPYLTQPYQQQPNVWPAQPRSCITRPDGFGGYRTFCQ